MAARSDGTKRRRLETLTTGDEEHQLRMYVRRVENGWNADAMLVIPPRDKRREKMIPITLPTTGLSMMLGRPHLENTAMESFVPICEESNRKISRKLALLTKITPRKMCLTRNRNTVTSIIVDRVNYRSGEPAYLEKQISTVRFGATANKEHEVHAYFLLPSTDDAGTYFDIPAYDPRDFGTGSIGDQPMSSSLRNLPTLRTLAAQAAVVSHGSFATATEKKHLLFVDDRLQAAEAVVNAMRGTWNAKVKDAKTFAMSLFVERTGLARQLRRARVAATVRAQWIANAGIEPSAEDLDNAVAFQIKLADNDLANDTKSGSNRGELKTIHCPACRSPLTPAGRLSQHRSDDDNDENDEDFDLQLLFYSSAQSRHQRPPLFIGGVKVDLVCDMNHDCPLHGMPFWGAHLKLCHSTEMRFVLGEGYSRRLASREGELPSGFCDAERHVYKPGNCDAVFVDPGSLVSNLKHRACKTCPADAAALYCLNCVEHRPRRREGLFCCNRACGSGPACCISAERYQYRRLANHDDNLVRPPRSRDERRALLAPCGVCGYLHCRRCIHDSRICCNDCFRHAADFGLGSTSENDGDY